MGGVVPLGYEVEDRKLVVNEEEAEIVRLIFDLYLALGSIRRAERTAARGTSAPESAIARRRADNRRDIFHQWADRPYPGEPPLHWRNQPRGEILAWRACADRRSREFRPRSRRRLADTASLRRIAERVSLALCCMGKLFNDAGERMTPSYAIKQGVRYRYYISVSAMQSRERPSSICSPHSRRAG